MHVQTHARTRARNRTRALHNVRGAVEEEFFLCDGRARSGCERVRRGSEALCVARVCVDAFGQLCALLGHRAARSLHQGHWRQ